MSPDCAIVLSVLLTLVHLVNGFLVSWDVRLECLTKQYILDKVKLINNNPCFTSADAFRLLYDVNKHIPECRKAFIQSLATQYSIKNPTCSCTVSVGQQVYPTNIPNTVDRSGLCNLDPEYKALFKILFTTGSHATNGTGGSSPGVHHSRPTSVTPSACTTHEYIWKLLDAIETDSIDCQWDIIVHIKYALDHTNSTCQCSVQTVPTTTASTPTTPTTPTIPTTTASLITNYACDKFSVVFDVATAQHVDHPDAHACISGIPGGTNEAYVLATCNVSSPSNWRRGKHVMSNCASVADYTPVASYLDTVYEYQYARSGIFLGCLPTGFKMAIQHCNSTPEIVHLQMGGFFIEDPGIYYLIA